MPSPPKVSNLQFYSKVGVFAFFNLYVTLSLVFVQLFSFGILLLSFLKTPIYSTFRQVIRITQKSFGGMLVFLVFMFCPTELFLSGDYKDLEEEKAIIIANHQIYPDWVYLWLLARKFNRHGDIKIMLINILKYLPVYGIGMQFFEFIFMKQKLVLDRLNIIKAMDRQKTLYKDFPVWLLIFPEGTLNTPNNRETSQKYAKKMGLKDEPKVVILPKATGTFMVADALKGHVNTLFDVTVGYSGISIDQVAYDEYLIENVFFKGQFPKQIHFHVKKYSLDDIPGLGERTAYEIPLDATEAFDAATNERRLIFSEWIKQIFLEKDDRMVQFYDQKRFVDPNVEKVLVSPVIPDAEDWLIVGGILGSGTAIITVGFKVLSLLISLIFTILRLMW